MENNKFDTKIPQIIGATFIKRLNTNQSHIRKKSIFHQ